jgi:hypothetical protein
MIHDASSGKGDHYKTLSGEPETLRRDFLCKKHKWMALTFRSEETVGGKES